MRNLKTILMVLAVCLLVRTASAQEQLRGLDDALDRKLTELLQKNIEKLKGKNAVYMFAIRFSLSKQGGKVTVDSISSNSVQEAELLFSNINVLKATNFERAIGAGKKTMFVKPVIVYVISEQTEDKTYTMQEVLQKGMSLLDDKHNGKKYQPEDFVYEKRTLQPFLMLFDLNQYH